MSSALPILVKQQLKATAELIKRYGRQIVLHRPAAMVDDGAGGLKRPVAPDTVLPSQLMYFGGKINNRMNNLPFETTTAIGEFMKAGHVIVGMPIPKWELEAIDIKEDDWFLLNGKRYDVTFLHDDRTYQIKAECKFVGT
jgi:hypothetical protein